MNEKEIDRLMKDAVKSATANAPDYVILGRAMSLSGDTLDLKAAKKWLSKAKKQAAAR